MMMNGMAIGNVWLDANGCNPAGSFYFWPIRLQSFQRNPQIPIDLVLNWT